MKKLLFTIAACLVAVLASAQPMGGRPMGGRPMGGRPMGGPMGGMEKPFYELESDSIADAKIQDVAGRLDLTEKQFDKMIKLYAQEFEEICRNLQMAVREYQMMQNGGFRGRGGMMGAETPNNVQFDTAAARKTYDQIIAKYDKRYKKALEAPQYEVWKTLSATTLDNKFSSILQHVQENTQSMF
ncbi:MAG: hypothetical protein J6T97_06250 [Bacteroidaceae bacterium]|nr:hypothetical protein [Bacteroidaceae bacterium]